MPLDDAPSANGPVIVREVSCAHWADPRRRRGPGAPVVRRPADRPRVAGMSGSDPLSRLAPPQCASAKVSEQTSVEWRADLQLFSLVRGIG
jgi:hypothetical protein